MCETTLSERLKIARERANLTQGEIARLLGLALGESRTPQAVSAWETQGKEPDISTIRHLATILRVNAMWLAWGVGEIENITGTVGVSFRTEGGRPVPRLNMQTAVMEPIRPQSSAFEVHTYFDCGPNSFAIDIADRSNTPNFQIGDAVVIDPHETPRPGDMVLAAMKPGERPVFRRYAVRTAPDASKFIELKPLNSDWESDIIRSPEDGRIVGVMTEHASPRR
jgi:SOS-response transcriptional repressor LexA